MFVMHSTEDMAEVCNLTKCNNTQFIVHTKTKQTMYRSATTMNHPRFIILCLRKTLMWNGQLPSLQLLSYFFDITVHQTALGNIALNCVHHFVHYSLLNLFRLKHTRRWAKTLMLTFLGRGSFFFLELLWRIYLSTYLPFHSTGYILLFIYFPLVTNVTSFPVMCHHLTTFTTNFSQKMWATLPTELPTYPDFKNKSLP